MKPIFIYNIFLTRKIYKKLSEMSETLKNMVGGIKNSDCTPKKMSEKMSESVRNRIKMSENNLTKNKTILIINTICKTVNNILQINLLISQIIPTFKTYNVQVVIKKFNRLTGLRFLHELIPA